MKRKVFLVLASVIAILSLAACSSTPVVSSSNAQVRSLTSTGVGEIYIVPDVAYINIGVTVNADDVSTALAENNTQANAVSQALQTLGVEAKDIQTSSFNVYPMQDYGLDGQVSRRYYQVDNTVYVTVRDLTKLGDLLDAAVKAGANNINSISFDVADKAAAQAEARNQAIEKAQAEAESIATAAGVKLGELQSINVFTDNYTTPSYYGKGGAMADSSAAIPVAAGQLVITANANLVYFIK